MILWLLIQFSTISTFPVLVIGNRTQLSLDLVNITTNSLMKDSRKKLNTENHVDPSRFIRLKENDWRDAHNERMIIWSLESRWHPEFGKNFARGNTDSERLTRSSRMMSFMILGTVIGFILYTYLGHVLMVRRLDREEKAREVREIIKRSALLFMDADDCCDNERRRSLINMFRGFKL